MSWQVEFLDEAVRDMKRLDHSAQIQVLKGIRNSHTMIPIQDKEDGKAHQE